MAEGLLGFLGTPGGQGLLSAVAGGLAGARRGTPLNNIGRGLLAGTAGYAQGLDREQQAQQLALQQQDRAQMNELRVLQMAQARTQMEREQGQQAWRQGLPDVMKQATQASYGASDAGPTMTPANPDALKQYAMLPNSPFADEILKQTILPKESSYKTVGDTMIRIGANGEVIPVFTAPAKPESAPSAVKEYEYAKGQGYQGSFQQFQTEMKRAGATNVNVNSGQKDVQWGVPPKDMVWARDQGGNVITQRDAKTGAFSPMAIPIAGSAIESQNAADAEKARQRVEAAKASTANVLSAIQGAEKLVGGGTAGVGSVLSVVPGTSARDLAAQLETVKANLGFDRLQQMRDMSPTGGALGSVAVQELTALQSTVASLDQAQSPEQLRRNIAKAKKHYNNWLGIMEGKMPKQSETESAAPQPFSDPAKEKRYQDWVRSQGGQR